MAWKQILTKEARAEVERMIEAGEDPKPFLEEAGSKNPSAHEFMIRRQMEKKKAEGTPKPPKDKPQPRPQSEVRTVPAEDGVPPVVRTVAPLPDLENQENMEIPEVEVVMNEDGLHMRRRKNTVTKTQILAVRSTKTDIRYEINTDGTEISMMFGLDEVVMNVERMKEFAEELPGIMSQLGVEV